MTSCYGEDKWLFYLEDTSREGRLDPSQFFRLFVIINITGYSFILAWLFLSLT
jgi:hypothetical protein